MNEFIQPPSLLTALKALSFLVIAFMATNLMRRAKSSAAHRSLVWATTLMALLLLPLGASILPTLHIGVLPSTSPKQLDAPPVGEVPSIHRGKSNLGSQAGSTASTEANPTTLTAIAMTQPHPPLQADLGWNPLTGIGAIWLLGFVAVLSTTAFGWISLLRLRHQARACRDDEILDEIEAVRQALGIRRDIRLLMSGQREIPMTWGVFRPILHLPKQARNWTPRERRAVLLHELAHIKRYDSALQLLAQFGTALYWYNPLVWMANQALRTEQEAACDDMVLKNGASAPEYAQHLTEIVTGRSRFPWEQAVALAAGRQGKLESRVRDILASTRNRNTPSRTASATLMTGMASIALVFSVMSPFSPSAIAAEGALQSPGQASTDLNSLDAIKKTLIEQSLQHVDDANITRTTIEGMLQALDDPYAKYLSADELANMQYQLEAELFGIGAQLRVDDGDLLVVKPIPGSPALEAGITASDIIRAVDGIETQGRPLVELVKQIRGPLGTQVRLTIERNAQRQTITVTRGRIKLPTVYGLRGVVAGDGSSEPALLGSASNIGYLQVTYFSKHTAAELNERIKGLIAEGMKAAILDLRYCPGGSLEPATQTANLFLNQGTIVSIKGRGTDPKSITANHETHWKFPLIILVNEATASAAEIVCGALQDHDRATILGTRTFGKGSVQTLLHINNQLGAIRLTTSQYFPPSGRSIDRLPNTSSWGIEANNGFFIPAEEPESVLKNRLQGTRPISDAPKHIRQLTAAGILLSLNDRQLAGAIEAMESQIKSGILKRVGGSRSELQRYLRQQEITHQQSALLEKLTEIQSSIEDLGDSAQ